MNKTNLLTIMMAIGAALAAMWLADPEASADPVKLSELRTVDGVDYPVCAEEDCSDQPRQIGLWLDKDTGNWWLSLGETSYLVVDDTATDIN